MTTLNATTGYLIQQPRQGHPRVRLPALCILLLAAFPCLTYAAVKPLAEIKQLAKDGNYKQAISELDRIQKLNPTCDAAKKYDFYDVAMLMADCQLHFKPGPKALLAADTAAALADAAGDQDKLARATIFSVMIAHAKDNKYIPRTGSDHTPIDITDEAARELANPIVLADEFDACKQHKWNAKRGKGLELIVGAAKHFAGVRAIEHLVTGQTTESDLLGVAAAKDVKLVLQVVLKDDAHDLDRIAAAADINVNHQRLGPKGFFNVPGKAGLGGNRKTVLACAADCEAMIKALPTINSGFGGAVETDGVYRSADDLKQKAEALADHYAN